MCQNGVGGGGCVSRQVGGTPRVDQYMAACDIGCRTASVEFVSAASLLDRNELILLFSRRFSRLVGTQFLAVWSLTKC